LHHISSYLYDNKIQVLLLDEDPVLKTRDRIVYSRTLKVYKGVDNPITIAFRNSDQKAANIANKTFTFALTANVGNTSVWSTPVTISNVGMAIGQVVLDQANVANLDQQYYNYTISYTDGELTRPAYTDDNWGAAGQLQVISNVY
jgi:hypothetical protein